MKIAAKNQILTVHLEYKNSDGRKIAGCWDHSAAEFQKKPFIVIPPAYGETKKNALYLAYYLVLNGFNVLRYDATNHIGESDGEIFNYTFNQAKTDLIDSMDFVEERFHSRTFGIAATSLAVRIAIKTAAEDNRIGFIISMAGITNFRYSLQAIYDEDIIGDFLNNRAKGEYTIIGHKVKNRFLKVAVENSYYNLDSTINDINSIRIPIVFIHPENDEWNKEKDIDNIIGSSMNKNLYKIVIPRAMHQFYENPGRAKATLQRAVIASIQFAYDTPLVPSQITEPDIKDIIAQNKIEKAWLKKYELTKQKEQKFWSNYMNQYATLAKSNDYIEFFSKIVNIWGNIQEGDIILDAGCGNGHFGLYMIHSMLQRFKDNKENVEIMPSSFIYIGADFVEGPLKEAMIGHFEAKSKEPYLNTFQKFFYLLQDLNPAPQNPVLNQARLAMFSSNFFDKICCSLLLSYVKDPLSLLKEFFRVLKQGGKIVITTMKPHCDLSKIYRDYLRQGLNKKEIEDARLLLDSAGKIEEKENTGYYQFFSEDELRALLLESGGINVKTYHSFGNQANIAVAEK